MQNTLEIQTAEEMLKNAGGYVRNPDWLPMMDYGGVLARPWKREDELFVPARDGLAELFKNAGMQLETSPAYMGLFAAVPLLDGTAPRFEVRPDTPAKSAEWYARSWSKEDYMRRFREDGCALPDELLDLEAGRCAGAFRRLARRADEETAPAYRFFEGREPHGAAEYDPALQYRNISPIDPDVVRAARSAGLTLYVQDVPNRARILLGADIDGLPPIRFLYERPTDVFALARSWEFERAPRIWRDSGAVMPPAQAIRTARDIAERLDRMAQNL